MYWVLGSRNTLCEFHCGTNVNTLLRASLCSIGFQPRVGHSATRTTVDRKVFSSLNLSRSLADKNNLRCLVLTSQNAVQGYIEFAPRADSVTSYLSFKPQTLLDLPDSQIRFRFSFLELPSGFFRGLLSLNSNYFQATFNSHIQVFQTSCLFLSWVLRVVNPEILRKATVKIPQFCGLSGLSRFVKKKKKKIFLVRSTFIFEVHLSLKYIYL